LLPGWGRSPDAHSRVKEKKSGKGEKKFAAMSVLAYRRKRELVPCTPREGKEGNPKKKKRTAPHYASLTLASEGAVLAKHRRKEGEKKRRSLKGEK